MANMREAKRLWGFLLLACLFASLSLSRLPKGYFVLTHQDRIDWSEARLLECISKGDRMEGVEAVRDYVAAWPVERDYDHVVSVLEQYRTSSAYVPRAYAEAKEHAERMHALTNGR